jgi:hypothetical protein
MQSKVYALSNRPAAKDQAVRGPRAGNYTVVFLRPVQQSVNLFENAAAAELPPHDD